MVRHASGARSGLAGQQVALGRLSRVCEERAGELREAPQRDAVSDRAGGADLVARVTTRKVGQLREPGKGLDGLVGPVRQQEPSGRGSRARGQSAYDGRPLLQPSPPYPAPQESSPPAEGDAGDPPATQQADLLLGSLARKPSVRSNFVPHPGDPTRPIAA